MKFKVSVAELQKALRRTIPALPKRTTLPILEYFQTIVEDNKLKLIGSDQELTIMNTITVEEAENGTLLIPGKKINDIVSNLNPADSIEFTADEATLDIILKTHTGKYKFKGISAKEYVLLPELFETERPDITLLLSSRETSQKDTDEGSPEEILDEKPTATFFLKNEIIRLAEKTHFATCTDEHRANMNGVLFQFRGSYVNAVATDSYRLNVVRLEKDKEMFPTELDVIIPNRAIELLRRVEEDILMSFVKTKKKQKITHVRIDSGNTVITCRIIDEKFPAYETVIPRDHKLKLFVNQQELLNKIRLTSILSKKTQTLLPQVKFHINRNEMTVFGENEDTGDIASETLPCKFNGDNFVVLFTIKYVEEALENLFDEVSAENEVFISFKESDRPVLFKPSEEEKDLLMIIMPIRI